MILKSDFLITTTSGQEILDNSLHIFDLFANEADIWLYTAGYIPIHWHYELEIFVLVKGSVEIIAGEHTYILSEGEGCFINTEVLHSFRALTPSECLFRSFVFDANIVSGAPGSIFDTLYIRPLLEKGANFMYFPNIPENNVYFEQFQRAFAACETEPPAYEFQVRDALSQILLFIREKNQILSPSSIPQTQDTRLKQMLSYIDTNFSQNISTKDIADAAHICVREGQKLFQQYLQCTPVSYLQKKRLFSAAETLVTTDKDISEIALDCGFSSLSYFSKQFRLFFGKSPRQYRQSLQNVAQTSLKN